MADLVDESCVKSRRERLLEEAAIAASKKLYMIFDVITRHQLASVGGVADEIQMLDYAINYNEDDIVHQ